ncbi:glycosyltransferase family 4 protein [uncultured Draconibacterium sp.]|uniref:glycosyltransferase family 4 protein n=1 Tax=uncultured Draconibacterium sp. TaxID=1573823 RepID=UPI002AA7041E|nr:glycosyltransferase family 4 protein [uncultured Draconibacterium sp.]
MKNRRNRVLIVATSRKTRGGITSVVKAHETGHIWQKYNCKWLETHNDKSVVHKLIYIIKSFIIYLFILPSYYLVHIHTSEPSSALRKLPFLFIANLFNKKIIVHFHSFSPKSTINSKYKKVYFYLFQKADIILVLSEYWKNELQKVFKLENKIKVLYNPCSNPDFSTKHNKQKHILYAGTINARKGYADLIKAFSQISNKLPDWKIVFAGNGEIEKAKLLAKQLQVDTQIVFLGWINGSEKSKAFQQASAFCLPSYAEGFPMAILDAWAYGLPVVTTPVGGLSDVLRDGKNALVFTPGDIEKLAQQLQKIVEDKELRKAIAEESVNLNNKVFNQSVICLQLDNIYSELFNHKNDK